MCCLFVLVRLSHGGLPSHDRGGVRHTDNRGERAEGEAADLGHGGSGAIPRSHAQLLQRSRRRSHGVRHHQVEWSIFCKALRRYLII